MEKKLHFCDFLPFSIVNIVKVSILSFLLYNMKNENDVYMEVCAVSEEFDRIFELYSRDVYRLAYSYLLSRQDAEDITQKVFYKLYVNIKKIPKSDLEIKKWLFKVSVNESKNLLKSSWFRTIKKDNEMEFDRTISKKISIIQMLENVSKKNRITLYLFYYEGYDIKEISRIIGKSESAVKMRLSRGKEELKKEMEDYNG